MSALSKEQKQLLKDQLLVVKRELQNGIELADGASKPVRLDQSMVGRLSRMDAMQGQALALEIKRRNAKELKRIEIALAKMDGDEYGLCEECDELINPARLKVDPAATFCIICASRLEADG